jgi:hypothetical protein
VAPDVTHDEHLALLVTVKVDADDVPDALAAAPKVSFGKDVFASVGELVVTTALTEGRHGASGAEVVAMRLHGLLPITSD